MKIPLKTLVGWANKAAFNAALQNRSISIEERPYADVVGVHIYSQLDTRLALSAAEGEENAAILLRILQEYATAAEATGMAAGIYIFEVQGQRLHLFREGLVTAFEAEKIIVGFARAFSRVVSEKVSSICGGHAFHLRLAADYGRAVILCSSGDDESESLISLGVPANRPAKILARSVGEGGVAAGQLALNLAAFTDPDAEKWEVYELEPRIELSANSNLLEAANVNFSKIANRQQALFSREYAPNPDNPVLVPIRRQGFMFRGDLDGFSRRVKSAMSQGESAVVQLVKDFQVLMKYPGYFKERLPVGVSLLLFPWAGDCANLFLVCDDYNFQRTSLPNRAAIAWHEMENVKGSETRPDWRELMADSRWLVALAGGENNEADHGYILTGNVYAAGRKFHVGAGWGWGRSLEAEQSEGTKPDQTIIQAEDFSGLDSTLRAAYAEHPRHPSLFKVANLAALLKAARDHRNKVSASVGVVVPQISFPTPIPRSYGGF